MGEAIRADCHRKAEQPMKHWLTILRARWDEVTGWAKQKQDKAAEQLDQLKAQQLLIDQLLEWVAQKDNDLKQADALPMPDSVEQVNKYAIDTC